MFFLPQFRNRVYIIGIRKDQPDLVRRPDEMMVEVKASLRAMRHLASIDFELRLQFLLRRVGCACLFLFCWIIFF
jgi:site-specific DNA-cytosine methylase